MNRFTDPVVVDRERRAFLALWNSDMSDEELLKVTGYKNKKVALGKASALRRIGYEVSSHRISPKIATKKDTFVKSWNSDMTDREFQIQYRRPASKLRERAKLLREQGYDMKPRTFKNRSIAHSKPDYKPERAEFEPWEIKEILGQVRREVDRDIIAQLHATSRRYIQWMVDNYTK